MAQLRIPPLRYLSAADVMAAMPDVADRIGLAERTMVALVADAQLPPKIGVHPRPDDSFGHAMPAWMGGPEPDGSGDLLGMKWVAGYPTNATRYLPTIHGTVLLSDALTGLPRAILDAGPITAHRTAAVSGVAISRWARGEGRAAHEAAAHGGAARVALIGAGVQARSHLPVLAHLLPGASLLICDRDPGRAEALVTEVRAGDHGTVPFGEVDTADEPETALSGADLVITLVSFGPARQSIPLEAFAPSATVVAIDYDMCVPARLASDAALFLTDDRGQFLATRTDAVFAGYPDPGGTIGEAIRDGLERPAGRVLVSHLGVGLADVVFGDAILRRAEDLGVGTLLPR